MSRRITRSRQIAEVLSRNGLRALASQAGLGAWLPSKGEADGEPQDTADLRPELLAATLEELGTVFIKLGQVLATRIRMRATCSSAQTAR